MFEALIFVVGAQAAAQPAQVRSPSAELLEFLGDWSEQDAELLDEDPSHVPATPRPQRRRLRLEETQDEAHSDAQTDR